MKLTSRIKQISLALLVGYLLVLTVQQIFFPRLIYLSNQSGDSRKFGYALAVDGNYLAIGDPGANRVVLYHRGFRGRWRRMQNILPPEGSSTARAGLGFGYSLDLKDGILAIGSYDTNILGLSRIAPPNWYLGEVYVTTVRDHSIEPVRKILLPDSGWISGHSVALYGKKLAFAAEKYTAPGDLVGTILSTDLVGGVVEHLVGYPGPSIFTARTRSSMDAKGDLLLIGDQNIQPFGGGHLVMADGRIEPVILSRTAFNSTDTPVGASAILIANDVVVLGIVSEWNTQETLFLRRSISGQWVTFATVSSGGLFDANSSQFLISVSPFRGMSERKVQLGHILVRVNKEDVVIQSKIRWRRGWIDWLNGKFNHCPTNGIIDEERLLLSSQGRVVSVASSNLPSSYWI
ncbi:MAG: hypothetical protein F6K30_22820 [Cyanothece sp. SIO2G6]|nr:hypothetical protein [Cyanothece sp. SIO2G6]